MRVAEYSFVIPHDVKTLIKLMGGEETFEKRLDMMVSSHLPSISVGWKVIAVIILTWSSLNPTPLSRISEPMALASQH
jgi:putative alpha-1,2-mannosidase